jgi:two-component system response regulator (stage 0 sporulation protein A)
LDGNITAFLQDLQIPANLKGYTFLREAITMIVNDFDLLNGITYRVYPEIAKKYKTIPSRVERAIRFAIESSYGRNYLHGFYQTHFMYSKPTNTQFIASIADQFQLDELVNQ